MLPNPASRTHLHKRELTFNGYAREDGLWDIEGRLCDIKSTPFNAGDRVWPPGEAIHDMSIRLTVDQELMIKDIEVSMDANPHPECPEVLPLMKKMIGCRIGKGWRKAIDNNIGGITGCTHLRELLSSMATAAFQSVPGILISTDSSKPPLFLGKCQSWDISGPVVLRHFPQFYRGKTTLE